jgi:brefeldin A-inhibited guanine nucleotide-exchange protein
VVNFAIDSLRQLSMKFLEKDELANFKFQKDFLKPFEYILAHNPSVAVKDLVLQCLRQMIQARGDKIKSGWKTMFGVFAKAAREESGTFVFLLFFFLFSVFFFEGGMLMHGLPFWMAETIVSLSFEIVKMITHQRFREMVQQNTFPDYITCLVEFCQNRKFTKIR